MILKALCDYYDRSDLPQIGTELNEIGYLIVINTEGQFIRIDSQMIDNKSANLFLVAKTVIRSGGKYVANYLWDNCKYVLGFPEDKGATLRKQKFVERIHELRQKLPQNESLRAVSLFYESFDENFEKIKASKLWDSLSKSQKNISFLLDGNTSIVAQDREVLNYILSSNTTNNVNICLVSGERGVTARIHSKIKMMPSKSTQTTLVSFQKKSGYDSYGKNQAYNAPISEDVEFKYTTALNKLLEFGSKNQFNIASRTFLFWASSNKKVLHEAEEALYAIFGTTENDDDPNERIASVRKLFEDIYSGKKPTNDEDRFYFLGLAPNSARIAVVYWHECSLKKFSELILRHFNDMEIIDTRKKKRPYQGLHQIASAVTLGGKLSDVQHNLLEAIIKSIVQGLPYPISLYQACLRRIRAEQDVSPYSNPCRAAIIKAYLNRLNNNEIKKEMDKQNTNSGYLCGRLFATLEKIQEDANNINSIRDRYINAASSTPSAVFATILNLSVHHIKKLNTSKQIFFEKLKQEIIDKLPAEGFPAHLDLQDQGRFFVGYYHQRQDFFVSKEAKEASINEEIE